MIPSNKNKLQLFLGNRNFIKRFIQDFFKIVGPIIELLEDKIPFEWTLKRLAAFEEIKLSIMTTPILRNPNLSKDFIMYAYGADKRVAIVLNYKEENHE